MAGCTLRPSFERKTRRSHDINVADKTANVQYEVERGGELCVFIHIGQRDSIWNKTIMSCGEACTEQFVRSKLCPVVLPRF